MDFFEAQDHARRRSHRLVFLFGAAVITMIAVVYLTLVLLWSTVDPRAGPGAGLHLDMLGWVTLGMLLLIGTGSFLRTMQLRKGGAAVAELLGGRRVRPDTDDPTERRLWNVVEEMSIASGTPVPAVFVLDGESGINAFAAGHTIHDAAIAVTRGTLEALDRDELQGVVAHEFSHILNGDMRLNLRLVGLLFGILLLTVVGRGILRGTIRSRGRGAAQVAILGFVLVALGYMGVFFGRLIQAAVSRQREYLADAAAVQFTRNPDGLAGALRKIGGTRGSAVVDAHAQELGHLFFAEGVRGALSSAFATHPPLEERIRRLRPQTSAAPAGPTASGAPSTGTSGAAWAFASPQHSAAALLATVGAPGPDQMRHARTFLERVPAPLLRELHTPDGAIAVIVALTLSDAVPIREQQLTIVRDSLSPETADRSTQMRESLQPLGPEARLPLLDLAIPGLRALSPEDSNRLRETVTRLIQTDRSIRPFDFALYHVLRRTLSVGEGEPARLWAGGRSTRSPARLARDMETILSALAHAGSRNREDVQSAFRSGAQRLPPYKDAWTLHPKDSVDLIRVDEALGHLEAAPPRTRKALLDAAITTVEADGHLDRSEVEMLRAISEALDAPIPPLGPDPRPEDGAPPEVSPAQNRT